MDPALVSAMVGAGGAVLGAAGGWLGKRRQYAREDRTDGIAERDALIRTITDSLIDPLRHELKELREWKADAERRIDALEDRNDRLVAFVYKLLGIIRAHGVDHEITPADVPPGIHL